MFRRARRLRGATVVIAGASSGIGRATALAFARHGAKVVVAARRADLLKEVAQQCEQSGGRALAVPTDVTDVDAVRALAREAEAAFGGIDVWINVAGTGVFGPYLWASWLPTPTRRVGSTSCIGVTVATTIAAASCTSARTEPIRPDGDARHE